MQCIILAHLFVAADVDHLQDNPCWSLNCLCFCCECLGLYVQNNLLGDGPQNWKVTTDVVHRHNEDPLPAEDKQIGCEVVKLTELLTLQCFMPANYHKHSRKI